MARCCVIENLEWWHPVVRCADGDPPDVPPFLLSTFGVHTPLLVDEVTPAWLDALEPTHALRSLVGVSRPSLIAVPIVVGARLLGAMLMLSEPDRRYDDDDLQLAVDLARRTGLAFENVRLYRVAQTASRARDEMLAIVAHDLRAPLAAVQFGADLLAKHVPEDRRASSRTAVDAIRRSVRLATRLVDDLLDVARIEEGRFTVVPKETTPDAIVKGAAESLAGIAAGAAVALDIDITPGLGRVLADEDRAHQALTNLVDNAVKFTPAGGRVRIVVTPDPGGVRFAVIDTGPGIPPEHMSRLFDRFWQARSGRRGAGLGLPIVKAIVEAHGGRIWADSLVGRGSTFAFSLPIVGTHGDAD
jgi:signal transduction histidine kinase